MKSNAEQWNYLDSGEIEYYTKEFNDILESEKSDVAIVDLVFSMSNKPFFETLYNYFSKIFPSMQKWETPQGQFFTFGEKGKARLKNLINARLQELKELIQEYEKIQIE
jgi:hypothetical protein